MQGLKDLDVDLLEMLMDRFEKAKHAVLCERQEDGEDGDAPEEKEPGVIYPASKAIQVSLGGLSWTTSFYLPRCLSGRWMIKAAGSMYKSSYACLFRRLHNPL